jgi:hypothetical protein
MIIHKYNTRLLILVLYISILFMCIIDRSSCDACSERAQVIHVSGSQPQLLCPGVCPKSKKSCKVLQRIDIETKETIQFCGGCEETIHERMEPDACHIRLHGSKYV